MEEIIEGVRIFMCLSFLAYASWSDYKTREVTNSVWIFFAPPAFALTLIELFFYDSASMPLYGICFALTAALAIILFYFGGFGGADAKALMCLALALPFYPKNLFTPILGKISPTSQILFPLTIFSNSVLLAATMAVYMLLHNIFWHWQTGKRIFEGGLENESLGKKILILATGHKVSISKLKEKWHVYPLEDVEGKSEKGFKRKLVAVPKDEGRNAVVNRLDDAAKSGMIKDTVWATPGLPMLIFITAGLIIALFLGDIIWVCISSLLG